MIQVPKAVTDEILAALQGYKPNIDLAKPCASCGKRPLPLRMLSHLFAAGAPSICCSHCHTDVPLATDIQDTPSFLSTTVLDTLRSPDGGELSASALLDIASQVGMPEEGKESVLEDAACDELYPRIPLALGFYDGTGRKGKGGIMETVSFRAHFHVLCTLKAIELTVAKKARLPKDADVCFRRASPGVLFAVYSAISDAGRQLAATRWIPSWNGILLSVAYTRRALARADQLLATLDQGQLPRNQMVEAFRSADLNLVQIRTFLTECLAAFFFFRFFVLRQSQQAQQPIPLKGGYEACKLMEQIDCPLGSMSSGGHFLHYCMGLSPTEHPFLYNTAVVWSTYRRTGSSSGVRIDEKNFRLAPVGRDLSRCFVATAAYGSPDAPDVRILQQFRDSLLLKSVAGRLFTRVYERSSPPLAAGIERSRMLRTVARGLVVRPAALLARSILRWSAKSGSESRWLR